MTHFFRKPDLGLFIFRITVGGLMIAHGVNSMLAGAASWEYLGKTMGIIGVNFAPLFWGLLAVLVQSFGGLCFLLGFFFRSACALLFLTMAMAVVYHVHKGDSLVMEGGQALLFTFIFLSFLFIGPGALSISRE